MIQRPPSRPSRRRLSLAAALPLAALGVAATPAFAAPRSTAPSAAHLVAAVKKAMLAEISVHFDVKSVAAGSSEHIVADAGKNTGRQNITSGKSTANVLLTAKDAYFDGNKSGLSTFFSMPAADITKVGTKWVYIKAGTSQYKNFKDGIAISGLPASFLPTPAQVKTASVADEGLAGKPAYALKWTVTSSGTKFNETLHVDATGTDLPIEAIAVSGKDHTVTTFSKWGETIHVTVPRSLIALTALTG